MSGHDVFLLVLTTFNVVAMVVNGSWFIYSVRSRRQRRPKLHANGVPVGLLPGDPIHASNVRAMVDYVDEVSNSN